MIEPKVELITISEFSILKQQQIDPIFVNPTNLKLGIKESEDSTQRKLIY